MTIVDLNREYIVMLITFIQRVKQSFQWKETKGTSIIYDSRWKIVYEKGNSLK